MNLGLDVSASQSLDWLKQEREDIHNYLKSTLSCGVDIHQLMREHALMVDKLIAKIWPRELKGFCVLATGGFGRRALYPHSDLDFVIVYNHADSVPLSIHRFIQQLWDAGFKLGSSIRSFDQCLSDAKVDIKFYTSLLEARYIAGDQLLAQLWQQLQQQNLWSGLRFFEEKIQEHQVRHHKYNYSLEPNIKTSAGGLRDLHIILWVIKHYWQSGVFSTSPRSEIIEHQEYAMLRQATGFLSKVRFYLHFISGQPENRLLFDYQKQLAQTFGYKDADSQVAVECFMQDFYRHSHRLQGLSQLILQACLERIKSKSATKTQPLGNYFIAQDQQLILRPEFCFAKQPQALLEGFVLLAKNPALLGFNAATIRAIRADIDLIDQNYQNQRQNRQLFLELFDQSSGPLRPLQQMYDYGVLAAYLPEFKDIVGKMQFDLYHVHTVDRHTLAVIAEVQALITTHQSVELEQVTEIAQSLSTPRVLYLAALFHDLGKGRGGAHSEWGADAAYKFCQNHQMSKPECDQVAWLARHHLLISLTAQKKDISDLQVLKQFVAKIGSQQDLDYLFVLTVADMRATNPKVWNGWKQSLLENLYQSASVLLAQGEPPQTLQYKQQNLLQQLQSEFKPNSIKQLWLNSPKDYLQKTPLPDLEQQFRAMIAEPTPVISVYQNPAQTMLFSYGVREDFLFAKVTAAVDSLGLNIVEARSYTNNHGLVISYYVLLDQSGQPIKDYHRSQEIKHRVATALKAGQLTPVCPRRQLRSQFSFEFKPQIQFETTADKNRVLLTIKALDRQGLLATIAKVLTQAQIKIHYAKIATLGEKAEDYFLISCSDGQSLDVLQQKNLKTGLLKVLP